MKSGSRPVKNHQDISFWQKHSQSYEKSGFTLIQYCDRKSINGLSILVEESMNDYDIENNAKKMELSAEVLIIKRQNEALPVLNEFKNWLISIKDETPPKGLLGKAISYTLNQWQPLENYVHSPIVPQDNNLAENAIRPFVLGRKNWLFANTPGGADASAVMYSLIETAKANALDPYSYLRFLFESLPHVETEIQLKSLLPQFLKQKDLVFET